MCGFLGPTAGEAWLAHMGVSDEYPDTGELAREVDDAMWEAALLVLEERKLEDPLLRALTDERATLWTLAKRPAGTLPIGTFFQATSSYAGTWWGKIRERDNRDSEVYPPEVCVEWGERVTWGTVGQHSTHPPEVKAATEVDARVPVPFDLSALLAQIERETGQRCRQAPRRRREGGTKAVRLVRPYRHPGIPHRPARRRPPRRHVLHRPGRLSPSGAA
jgi:hypothetical protein